MRVALGIEYDGSAYHGWQHQEGLVTLQDTVEKALSRVADHPMNIVCAGRTDAGVHALDQVVHFDTDAERSEYSWIFGANSNLPHDISVRWAREVDESFHARYSATARRYRYILYNYPIRPALARSQVTWWHFLLDENRMRAASAYLIGEHDFSSFRGIDCQSKTPKRKIHEITILRKGPFVIVEVQANSFLHHMVRNIVGVLLAIGECKREPIWAKEVLEGRDRKIAGITAPPNGLYLVAVDYPEHYQLPKQKELTTHLGLI